MNIINIRLGSYHLIIDNEPKQIKLFKNSYWADHKYPKLFEVYNWFNRKHRKS